MNFAVFSPLLEDRRMAGGVCGAGAVHLGCIAAGLPGWQCPMFAATGVPCPGCGLSRAALTLLRGDVAGALALHAFAPALLVAMALLLAATLPVRGMRERVAAMVRGIELRTGASAWLLGGLLIYWALRLVLDWPGPIMAHH